jgi:hypothetical protein
MPTMRALSRMDFPCALNSCMVFTVPLLIMAPPCICDRHRIGLLKGWVNSFLASMGQLYISFNTSFVKAARTAKQYPLIASFSGVLRSCKARSIGRTPRSCFAQLRFRMPIGLVKGVKSVLQIVKLTQLMRHTGKNKSDRAANRLFAIRDDAFD